MRSMTGYGKGSIPDNGLSIVAEIKTVNHKFLAWSIKMPKSLLFVEDEAKKVVASKVNRGHIDLFITLEREAGVADDYVINEELAKKYVATARALHESTAATYDVTVTSLMKNQDITSLKASEVDEDILKSHLLTAIKEAVKALIAMRENEGVALANDISSNLDSIETKVDEIKKIAPTVVVEYRKKLLARINETLGNNIADDQRIAQEVAIFADKCAIDEEISRLKAHIKAMREYLKQEGPIGRKMDFLVQEMNREANTIGSKANDLGITERVLDIKNDIEKIREQSQNVE